MQNEVLEAASKSDFLPVTETLEQIYALPLNDLLFRAHVVHRENFDPNKVQMSALLSIKTGGCPEDCKYCPQSAHYQTSVDAEPLMQTQAVVEAAKKAKAEGATRFCMGAAWKNPRDKDLDQICSMINEVKALGLETCATLGMLKEPQAVRLKEAGLDYYNHNIDTSPEYYDSIITTRTFEDRLDTLATVSNVGMKVCCGGIVGMGEGKQDRLGMIRALTKLKTPPESVPLNMLMPIEGTPMANEEPVDPIDFVRLVATTRIALPTSYIRLSAGREKMSEELQAMCFFAGANSVFMGEKLLTAGNPDLNQDEQLFKKLGIEGEV